MKNVKRFLTLFLLLGLMLSVAVFAEGGEPGTIKTIEISKPGVEAADYEGKVNFKLTYSDAPDGGMYLVLVQSETGVPTGENILYVNQVTAGEDPEVDGAYFANVYPSEIVYEEVKAEEGNNYSYIYLSGTDLPRELVGTIKPYVEELPPTGVAVNGTVESFGAENGVVTIQLLNDENVVVAETTTTTAQYSLTAPTGTYTMTVAKENHVTRSYEVVVQTEAVVQDVKIHLKGDINGDGEVNTSDNTLMIRHIKKTRLLTGYQLDVANINGDNDVNTSDNTLMIRHIKQTRLLW